MLKIAAQLSIILAGLAAAQPSCAQPKPVLHSIDDLPQASYPIHGSVTDILTAPPGDFTAATARIRGDIDRTLTRFQINDNATLRTLLAAKLAGQIASGTEDRAALATIEEMRAHEDKDEARLISGLAPQAFLEGRLADATPPGTCPPSFQAAYAKHLGVLPWQIVGVSETRLAGLVQLASPAFMIGFVAPDIQPVLERTHALSSALAWELMSARTNLDVIVPCHTQVAAATHAYIQQHAVAKPDIWPAREAVLPRGRKLTPVAVAIWDSGFDSKLFANQLLTNDAGQPVTPPAYDVEYRPTTGELAPRTAADIATYPQGVSDANGVSDLQTGIDSPAAAAFRKQIAAMSPARMQSYMVQFGALESYMHGTHVAGIAARGNPAIRMVSARVTYDPKPIPTPPTDDLQHRLARSHADFVAWFRAHHIRVVNMSWWNRPSNTASDLEKNGIGKDAGQRKTLARHYFSIERDALYAALKSAPDILFVTIAGNNNSDNAFEETIPSSFRLPNLLVVGAVDQAGQETSFTSTGQNIGVYANGYEVESVVPGGAKVHMSGTSMAAPEVTNLAAKLLAVDPGLNPEQLIAIIKRTADASEGSTILRINPRLALASLSDAKR